MRASALDSGRPCRQETGACALDVLPHADVAVLCEYQHSLGETQLRSYGTGGLDLLQRLARFDVPDRDAPVGRRAPEVLARHVNREDGSVMWPGRVDFLESAIL